ncbi:unnamed protein product [Psylliodes chrysocephalus]|uniref:HAT C-terminal dimerisation domain-containing protein n=1 Tax=Psylliodes chrysocephalus TaxID=3402493 RepID=A0A9P0D4J1_9CUCU|nr:unnamed protein product [Psylliodes chrysocephala]
MYEEYKKKLKNVLKEVNFVAITTDSWTSVATESYLTITCHYINEHFELKRNILSLKQITERHTTQQVFGEWEISKKSTCIVTDNASNMFKACDLLKIRHLGCYAHTLNLVVQENLKLVALQSILTRCKYVVRHFKSSTHDMNLFKKEQQNGDVTKNKPLQLLQDVPTRWNSTLYMIQRIITTNNPLNRTLLNLRNAPSPFTIDEFSLLKDIEKCLECFEEATKQVSGSNYITVSLIIPLTLGIFKHLTDCIANLNTEEGKQLFLKLTQSVRQRLFSYETRSVTRIFALLDPRFKKEGFRNPDNAVQATNYLEQEMGQLLKASEKEQNSEQDSPKSTSPKNRLLSFIGQRVEEKSTNISSDIIIIKRQYFERPNCREDIDPLLFGKVTRENINPLPELIQKIFCIPATSMESERTFSSAEEIIYDTKSRLKSKKVKMLIFLNKNHWLL